MGAIIGAHFGDCAMSMAESQLKGVAPTGGGILMSARMLADASSVIALARLFQCSDCVDVRKYRTKAGEARYKCAECKTAHDRAKFLAVKPIRAEYVAQREAKRREAFSKPLGFRRFAVMG